MALIVALAACGTSPAPAFKGRWQPVNRFPTTTQAIPLDPPYAFYASPTDGTLKQLLGRWAKDADMPLAYQHPSDFTLHAEAARIRSVSFDEALALLESAYLAQHLEILTENGRVVVRPADAVVRARSSGATEATP